MTARASWYLVIGALASGCYLSHETDEAARDAGPSPATDAGAHDATRDATAAACSGRRHRIVCEPPVEIAVTPAGGTPGIDPTEILDARVATDRVTLLLGGAGSPYIAFATLDLEEARLMVSLSWRDGIWQGAHAARLVRPAGDEDVAFAVRTDRDSRQEFRLLRASHRPGEVGEPTVETLGALEGWCGHDCRAAVGAGERGAVWTATPSRDSFALSMFDGAGVTATRTVSAPAPFSDDGLILSGASHGERMLLAASGSFRARADAFGVLLDGSVHFDVDIPGDRLDPPPVAGLDRRTAGLLLFRHVTNREDTFDRAISAWHVAADGELGPSTRIPTDGAASLLRLFVSSDSDHGPVIAWSERVPGSLTDIRVGVVPSMPEPERDTCASIAAPPLLQLPRISANPSVAAVRVGDETILFHFADRSPDVEGDGMLVAQRIACSLAEE